MESLTSVTMYVDGNHTVFDGQWIGGWAFKLRRYTNGRVYDKDQYGFASKGASYSMRLTAILEGIKALNKPCSILIVVNDESLVSVANTMKEYVLRKGYRKDNKPMAYPDLWAQIIEAASMGHHRLKFVKGDSRNIIHARTDAKLIMKS